MNIYLCRQCLMSTFRYLLWSSYSVQSLVVPTGEMVFLSIQICNSWGSCTLWISSQPLKEFAQQQVESCAGFVFSEHNICFLMLCCYGVFWTISDMVFKPISCQLMNFSNDRLVAWARPFQFSWQCWLDIRYEYWKWSALRNRKDLPCETKPTVFAKSRCSLAPYPGSSPFFCRGGAWVRG